MMDISHAGGASEKTSAMQHTPTVDFWEKKHGNITILTKKDGSIFETTSERGPKDQVNWKVVWLYMRADFTHAYAFPTLACA